MEVYIDDILVKSVRENVLEECFEILNKYQMKLNLAKFSFGVSSEKFLGYLVTHKGIEAYPNQLHTLHEIPSPRNR